MIANSRTEASFETVIEAHLLAHGYVPVDRAGLPSRDPAEGMGEAGSVARGEDRRTGSGRPMQVDGRQRLARHPAARFQVLRPDAPHRLLQGGARPAGRHPRLSGKGIIITLAGHQVGPGQKLFVIAGPDVGVIPAVQAAITDQRLQMPFQPFQPFLVRMAVTDEHLGTG